MTEQQPYRVLARHPGFELRRYPAHLVAEVRTRGFAGRRHRPSGRWPRTCPGPTGPRRRATTAGSRRRRLRRRSR